MKPHDPKPDDILDRAVRAIRDESVDPAAAARAADRVHAALGDATHADLASGVDHGGELRSCADFQALLPAYLDGQLAEARRLLVRDHVHSCIPCRRRENELRTGLVAAAATVARPARWPRIAAAAAAITLAVGAAWIARQATPVSGMAASIESIDGTLYAVGSEGTAIRSGHELTAGEGIRSAKETDALVRLADGSLIELDARTEIRVHPTRRGTTIELSRGNIIVEAAEQRDGHLYVKTEDCLVSVTGTVFSVNRGTKGSRVSVIEGRVEVEGADGEHVLGAGDQVSTHPSLGRVPVEQEIAWSQRLDDHLALLGEFASIGKQIDETIRPPAPRASSRLLDLVPASTIVYAAVPNLGRSVSDAYDLFKARMAESTVLQEWWQSEGADDKTLELDRSMARLRELGDYLGDEIVFTIQVDQMGDPSSHLILAEAPGAGLFDFLARQAEDTNSHGHMQLVDDPFGIDDHVDGAADLYVWVKDGLVAATDEIQSLQKLAYAVDDPESYGVRGTSFHQRIAESYLDGVSWVFAADMRTLVNRMDEAGNERRLAAWESLGLLDMTHLVIEQRDDLDGQSHREAVLGFDQARRGIASWLAEPAPMGSLEFISPDAVMAGAFVVKEPVRMLDDLFDLLESAEPGLRARLQEFESTHGLRLRDDIAAPLGGEMAFAFDGPILPEPAWKLIMEVYDPSALAGTLATMVEQLNLTLREEGHPELELIETDRGGYRYFELALPAPAPSVHWAFADGYMVMAPSNALVERAIQYRSTGVNLARSENLMRLFPGDRYANFSALVYQDISSVVAPLAERALAADSDLPITEEQRAMLAEMAANAEPTLLYGYAESDRLRFAHSGRSGLLGLDLQTFITLSGILGLEDVMRHDAQHYSGGRQRQEAASTP